MTIRKNDPPEEQYELTEEKKRHAALKITSKLFVVLVLIILAAADFILQQFMQTRTNERTLKQTKRIRFSPRVKTQLFQQQNGHCIYCGKRKIIKNLQIDHINPVVRSGPNDMSNLQLLCAPCNQRKGIHSNIEFHQRYRKVASQNMLKSPPQPPTAEISQETFRQETRETQTHQAIQHFKNTKYISNKTKINGGSAGAGIVTFFVWLLGIPLITSGTSDLAAQVALWGGIILGIAVASGLRLRASKNGFYEQ